MIDINQNDMKKLDEFSGTLAFSLREEVVAEVNRILNNQNTNDFSINCHLHSMNTLKMAYLLGQKNAIQRHQEARGDIQ